MFSTSRLASLVIGLASSPAVCLPRPSDRYSAQFRARATPPEQTKIPGWKATLIIVGIIMLFILLGLTGGALEFLLGRKSKQTAVREEDDDLGDPGSQGRRGVLEIAMVDKEKEMDEEESFPPDEGDQAHFSGSGRYSWRDQQGVVTETYVDGALPDAGPTGLASNPPFVVHDEDDDSDAESPPPGRSAHDAAPHPGHRAVTSMPPTGDGISPLTPGDHVAEWPQHPMPAAARGGEAGLYFSDVDINSHDPHQGQI